MSRIEIPEPIEREIAAASRTGYPLEICGLLIGTQDAGTFRVTRSIPSANVAAPAERHRRFQIEPKRVVAVERGLRGTGEGIVGFYHSHPDAPAMPSRTDMEYVRLWPDSAWLIVPVEGGEPRQSRAWLLGPDETSVVELDVSAPTPARLTS